jgi:polysaccharide biosynthesis/export protein
MHKSIVPIALLATVWCYPAQGEPAKQGAPANPVSTGLPAGRINTSKHVIQAGDQIELHIFNLPDLQKVYTVRADGRFFHPLAGDVAAAGRTIDVLESQLKKILNKELREPRFKVGIHSVANGEVAVVGEVERQGKYTVPQGTSLLDLLAQAGGLTTKADVDAAMILRQGKQLPVSLAPKNQAQLAEVILQNGDIFFVSAGRRVSVVGEVKQAGIYAISSKSGNEIGDAIKAAGGTRETAALTRVLVVRPSLSQPIVVDLLGAAAGQQSLPTLEDGDTVVINPKQAVVLGAFTKPGAYPLTGNETLIDIISGAGAASTAKLDSIVVVRSNDVQKGTEGIL